MTKAQKVCFLLSGTITFVVFLFMNLLSSSRAYSEFNSSLGPQFDHSGYSWGWPFDMYNSYTGYPSNDVGFGPGVIFNILAFLVSASILGVAFIYLIEKLKIFVKDENI
jgi:hypothetical protein